MRLYELLLKRKYNEKVNFNKQGGGMLSVLSWGAGMGSRRSKLWMIHKMGGVFE